MLTKSTREISEMLRVPVPRLDGWFNRQHFVPQADGSRGVARQWSFAEALRLSLFIKLVDLVGIDPPEAGIMTALPLWLAEGQTTFFVAYHDRPEFMTGWQGSPVPVEDLGQFLQGCCPRHTVMSAGHSPEVVARNSEKPEMAPAYAAVIIDLSALAADLHAAWDA
jgi:hypothetical protein